MKRTIIYALLVLTFLTFPIAAKSPSEIKWLDTIGQDKSNPDLYYSFLFLGFLRQELCPDCKTFIGVWLKNHQTALVVPVAIDQKFDSRNTKSKLICVWIVDDDNLGVDIVRHGCAPAAFLFTLMPGAKLEVSPHEFEQVKKRLLAAEKLAKTERIGIWSDDTSAHSVEDK